MGTSGIFGLCVSKHIFSSFNFSGRLTLLTNNASFTSADTIKRFVVDTNSGNSVPYFESKEINLKNFGLGIDAGLD
jgi:hypothetical protein